MCVRFLDKAKNLTTLSNFSISQIYLISLDFEKWIRNTDAFYFEKLNTVIKNLFSTQSFFANKFNYW